MRRRREVAQVALCEHRKPVGYCAACFLDAWPEGLTVEERREHAAILSKSRKAKPTRAGK